MNDILSLRELKKETMKNLLFLPTIHIAVCKTVNLHKHLPVQKKIGKCITNNQINLRLCINIITIAILLISGLIHMHKS